VAKGVSGNPSGRPAHDVASEIAQALFMNNPKLVYEAFLKVLKKGSPYGFQVLADRAFRKLKEVHQVEHGPYHTASFSCVTPTIHRLQPAPANVGWRARRCEVQNHYPDFPIPSGRGFSAMLTRRGRLRRSTVR